MLFRLQIRFIFSILNFISLFQTYLKRNYTKFFPCANRNNTILLISLSFIIISVAINNSNISFAQSFEDNNEVDNSNVEGGDNSVSRFSSDSDDDITISDNGEYNVPISSDIVEEEITAETPPLSVDQPVSERPSADVDLEKKIDLDAPINNQMASDVGGMFAHSINNQLSPSETVEQGTVGGMLDTGSEQEGIGMLDTGSGQEGIGMLDTGSGIAKIPDKLNLKIALAGSGSGSEAGSGSGSEAGSGSGSEAGSGSGSEAGSGSGSEAGSGSGSEARKW